MIPMERCDRFRFSCHPGVSCFNACCRDLNQFLTPYDIVCMKNRLEMTSSEFLKRYTARHVGRRSGLPIVTLKPRSDGAECPFVSSSGCLIYAARPTSCRIYPLARAVSKPKAGGGIREHFALIKESHCRGFSEGQQHTVSEWIDDQGLHLYNQMNDLLLGVIRLKNRRSVGPLDQKHQELFYTACYDLDRFKTDILEREFLDGDGVIPASETAAGSDDVALLKQGIQWIKGVLNEI